MWSRLRSYFAEEDNIGRMSSSSLSFRVLSSVHAEHPSVDQWTMSSQMGLINWHWTVTCQVALYRNACSNPGVLCVCVTNRKWNVTETLANSCPAVRFQRLAANTLTSFLTVRMHISVTINYFIYEHRYDHLIDLITFLYTGVRWCGHWIGYGSTAVF